MTIDQIVALANQGGAAPNILATVPWVGQWKFNNNGNDSVGVNNLTNNNSATFTTGKIGGATGATSLVAASTQSWSVASNANLQIGGVNFMVVAWVNPNDVASAHTIIGKDADSAQKDFRLDISGSTARFIVFGAGGIDLITAAISAGAWSLIVAWYDGTNIKINVNNGTTQTKVSGEIPVSGTGALEVGVGRGLVQKYDGLVDMCALAKGTGSVPTQAILDALYNGSSGTETLT